MQIKMQIKRIVGIFVVSGLSFAQQPPQQPQQNYPQQYPSQYPQPASQYPPSAYPPPQQPQYMQGQPPLLAPAQLEPMVARIALYPDELLAQVLAAASYPDQIPDAAQWSDQHHYLSGQALANAILGDQLWFAPPVQALLPFPSVLDIMATDMNWTYALGNAFLVQEGDVMEAVQRQRQRALSYGYLRDSREIAIGRGPYITITAANPLFLPVPYYDPSVVFFAPRRGFNVGVAINFRFGVSIGAYYDPWGIRASRFDWGARTVFLNNARWDRNWNNRGAYQHPYRGVVVVDRRGNNNDGFNRGQGPSRPPAQDNRPGPGGPQINRPPAQDNRPGPGGPQVNRPPAQDNRPGPGGPQVNRPPAQDNRPADNHRLEDRSSRERAAPRTGKRVEEHKVPKKDDGKARRPN
jgi:hypothetical protein